MNEEIKSRILGKIKEYDRIVISRHIRPDGDAVGSSLGLREILRLTYPEKDIRVINEDFSDYMAFLGREDAPADDGFYSDALGIVVDTATEERISNGKIKLCREIIKIDHHVDIKPYGDISWVEDKRAAACEMIADFYLSFKDELKISKEATLYIYTGIVTDSGRFKYESSNGDTLRCAAAMLDKGVDTESLFSNLYLDDFSFLKYKAYILNKLKITENGVAYLYVDKAMQEKFGLSREDASNSVSFMDSIKGSIIWIAFIDNGDETIRVRLRSRFVTVNRLAEKYHGGGHERASGATVYSKKEMKALIKEADALIKEYKASNGGWM